MKTDIATALAQPGCERLREWASIGPVQMAALEDFVGALEAECEALRKYKAAAMLMVEDARRYHKWRSEFCKNEPTEMLVSLAEFMTPEQVDAVIDAAISKEQQ